MNNASPIKDSGIFSSQKFRRFQSPTPYDDVINILNSIGDYRLFASPDRNQEWKSYIKDIFHLFGFKTTEIGARALTIKEMGMNAKEKAIVIIVYPEENLSEILPDLDWKTYLNAMGEYYEIPWGILTNGFQMEIYDLTFQTNERATVWCDFEDVIQHRLEESFFYLHKLFSYLRSNNGESPMNSENNWARARKKTNLVQISYDLSWHLNGKPSSTLHLFELVRNKTLEISYSIEEKFNKLYIAYSMGNNFLEIHIQKYQLKIWIHVPIESVVVMASECRDVRNVGHYGPGVTEININDPVKVPELMKLVHQSFELNCK